MSENNFKVSEYLESYKNVIVSCTYAHGQHTAKNRKSDIYKVWWDFWIFFLHEVADRIISFTMQLKEIIKLPQKSQH